MTLYNPQKDQKNEKVQERSLKFIFKDYDKTLLDISKKATMEVKTLRILITEIFKILNDSDPASFHERYFSLLSKQKP